MLSLEQSVGLWLSKSVCPEEMEHTEVEVPQIICEALSKFPCKVLPPSTLLTDSPSIPLDSIPRNYSWKEKIVEVPTVEVREVIKQVSRPEVGMCGSLNTSKVV